MCGCVAVGVRPGPSAYPPFPILPSLSFLPYLPALLPSLRHSSGSEVLVKILDLVPFFGFTPSPTSPPYASEYCSVLPSDKKNESVDLVQCIRSLSLPIYLIRPSLLPPKSLTGLPVCMPPKNTPIFGQKPPSLPAPRPLWGSGNQRLSPPLVVGERRVVV